MGPLLEAFRTDLTAGWDALTVVAVSLAESGYQLTPLRVLELLIWIETEPRGHYRS